MLTLEKLLMFVYDDFTAIRYLADDFSNNFSQVISGMNRAAEAYENLKKKYSSFVDYILDINKKKL
jgi:hypothetical protein